MFSPNMYGEIFEKLCECNAAIVKNMQQKPVNNPMQEALVQLNSQDLGQWVEEAAQNPLKMMDTQIQWWHDQMNIWQTSLMQAVHPEIDDAISAEKGDKRFDDPAWKEQVLFNVLKQSYLLFSRNMLQMIDSSNSLEKATKERLNFFTRQMINALSPTNFLSTNPELIRLTFESKGENLVKGMSQLQEDMKLSADVLKVRLTKQDAFKVGVDLASTPGEVVFRNELIELLQYHPSTETVAKRPILIVPPFINKYYVMDMREQNSLVRWLVSQGHSVFMISWVNPDESLAEYEFGHYATRGVIPALEKIEDLTGEQHVNAIGYCVGGMLLSTTAAYMVSKRMKQRIKSMTLLTTMLEFSNPGEIGVFINEPTITAIETQNKIRGYMDGRLIESTFSLLRENSLFWNYYVKNYLKGESPLDFDLLYWNSDSTNIAAACHNDILRKLYLNNLLKEPKGLEIDGVGIDLSKIKVPVYFLSAKDDHIAGWESTFTGSKYLKGKVTFVLGESGHIAGVINPPAKNKYGYWAGGDINAQDAQTWVKSADHHAGSWWTHWQSWSEEQDSAEKVPARDIAKDASLAAAPGSYVLQKLPIEASMDKAG